MVLLMIAGLLYAAFDMLLGPPWGITGLMGGISFWMAGLLMIGLIKSPMWKFMSAAYSGRPLLRVRRKDGTIVWEPVKTFSDGMLLTKNYGLYMISPKDPGSIDSKSGVKIYQVSDGLGNTISENQAKVLKYIYNNWGISDPEKVDFYLNNWHKCQTYNETTGKACGWEGVPKSNPIMEKNEETGEKELVGYTLHCQKCEGQNLLKQFPKMTNPTYETLDIDAPAELFYPAMLHPDKTDAFTHYMIKSHDAMSKKEVIKIIAIATAILMIMVGVAVVVTVLPVGGGASVVI